jgi:integrase
MARHLGISTRALLERMYRGSIKPAGQTPSGRWQWTIEGYDAQISLSPPVQVSKDRRRPWCPPAWRAPMKKKRGRKTNVAGLSRDGSAWIVRFRLKRSGVETKEVERRLEGGSKDDAVQFLLNLKKQAKEEMDAEAKAAPIKRAATTTVTDGEFVATWLHSIKAKNANAKQASLETRLQLAERFILPWLHETGLTLGTVEPDDIEDLWKIWLGQQRQDSYQGKRKNPRAGQAYSNDYLHSAWRTMGTLQKFVSRRLKRVNPMLGLRFDIQTGQAPRPKDAATTEEVAAIMKATREESRDIRVMIALEVQSGMRFCETSALWWSDIKLDLGMLRINRSQVDGEVGPPKTKESRRDVVLLPEIVQLLREHKKWQEENDVPGYAEGLVFPSTKGTYRFPSVLTKPLADCIRRAGLQKHLTSHSLRRTLVSRVVEAAGDATAQVMAGHATQAMTAHYNVVEAERRRTVLRAAFGSALAQ